MGRHKAKPAPPELDESPQKEWPADQKAQWVKRMLYHISEGGSLLSFCRNHPQGPQKTAFYEWLASDAIMADEYVRARERSADTLAEECVAIADEVQDAGQFDSARVNAARLRVDARKWVASKLKPKTYADRIEQVTSGALTVTHTVTDEDRAKLLASIVARQAIATAPNLIEAQRLIESQAVDVTPKAETESHSKGKG